MRRWPSLMRPDSEEAIVGPHPKRKLITLKGVVVGKAAAAAGEPMGSGSPPAPPAAPSAPAASRKPPASPPSPSEAIAAAKARRLAWTEALAWLAATYPAAFGPDVKPLAIGVGRLVWPRAKLAGIRRKAFNAAIGRRVSSPLYLDALAAAAAVRCDLNGRAVEPVSAEHCAGAIAAKADLSRLGADKRTQD
jgi:hypothetical protein